MDTTNFRFNELEEVKATGGKSNALASITKYGYCRLNKHFIKRNNLDETKFVQLKGKKKDETTLVIGLRFLEEKADNCINVTTDAKTGSKNFSLRSFFDHFNEDRKNVPAQKLGLKKEEDGENIFVAEVNLN